MKMKVQKPEGQDNQNCLVETGWTIRSGVLELLEPFFTPLRYDSNDGSLWGDGRGKTWSVPSFRTFRGLPKQTAHDLLRITPAKYLEDHQNCAPSLRDLLKSCVNSSWSVELCGYYVGPYRADERFSIDSMVVYPNRELKDLEPELHRRPLRERWEIIAEELGLPFDGHEPDEIEPIIPPWNLEHGWWIWWD
ncbi:hypothetical protein [Boudabousia liubingyangii]|nr:hypothetical protein [Boudabousia liubingyangii]